jgi:hypothetical protein
MRKVIKLLLIYKACSSPPPLIIGGFIAPFGRGDTLTVFIIASRGEAGYELSISLLGAA